MIIKYVQHQKEKNGIDSDLADHKTISEFQISTSGTKCVGSDTFRTTC